MARSVGQAVEMPRRFLVPPEAMGDGSVPLEFLRYNLYSSVALAGGGATPLPRQIECFNYLRGQTVPGAGGAAIAATAYHTNMQAVRTLPKPKTFVLETLRTLIVPLDFASGSPAVTDDTVGAANANLDQVDDITLITQALTLNFRIGEKDYVDAPLYMIPSNIGIAGVSAMAHANAAGVSTAQRVAINTAGRAWDFARRGRPPVLWNQQTFRCELSALWATNPSPVDSLLLFVILGGILGREIQ